MLVTMRVGTQLFGIPVQHVQDVLRAQRIARIPLAPPEIAGSINLRGRIVTVIDVRKRLHLEALPEGQTPMFVVVEHNNALYSLMVDSVGEVMNVPHAQMENTPANLQGSWREISEGVCRLPEELLVVIDIGNLLSF